MVVMMNADKKRFDKINRKKDNSLKHNILGQQRFFMKIVTVASCPQNKW